MTITDSSVIKEEKVSKLLIDNDLQDAVVNGTERAMHAFPIIDVLASLNERISTLEKVQAGIILTLQKKRRL